MQQVLLPGQPQVAVHSSHHDLGDPYDFVFYARPGIAPLAFDTRLKEAGKKWLAEMRRQGFVMRSKVTIRGPHSFYHPDRALLDPEHEGDDEYLLTAWFRRERPLLVSMDAIEAAMAGRRKWGYEVNEPVRPMDAGKLRDGAMQTASNLFRDDAETRYKPLGWGYDPTPVEE